MSESPPPSPPRAVGASEEVVRRWFTRGVASIGLASFFSDSGHELTTALLPSFLVSTLHASAGALGLIEGVSDGLIGISKLLAGPLANRPELRRRIAGGGYLGTALATGAIGLTVSAWQVGGLRALAWVSRGVRSPARDSLLASLAPQQALGRAFGVERAGDNLGAVAGPLLAAGLVTWVGIRPALYMAAIPGVLAAVAITVAAREARRREGGLLRGRLRFDLRSLRREGLVPWLVPIALFELGNVATTLLILRATQLLHHGSTTLATATVVAILIYSAHNAVGSLLAFLGGHWLDRSSARLVFGSGAVLYLLAYLGFALNLRGWPLLLLAFALAGAGIGLAETAESTLVARMLPDHLRGSGFGVLGAAQALGGFASSAVVGLLYVAVSPTVGFLYAAAWMALSGLALVVGRASRPHPASGLAA
ncbi:MAG TPA: MFS transporter [Candidatus Saccharimonadales bacterium]|nr:MFS transporter [Candidatus Saccharimonadales bacterium]